MKVGFQEGDFVRLQIGLKGRAETTLRGRQFEIDGLIGCVIPSGQPLSASFGKNYQQLIVRIKTDALERKLASGAGDDIKLDASYAKGATKYIISTSSTSPSFAMFGGTGNSVSCQSIG